MTTVRAERLMRLMAYVDGELDPRERAEVEGWLASDPEAAQVVGELKNLGVLVNVAHEASTGASAASFDVADAVMAAVKRSGPAEERPAANVIPLGAARRRGPALGLKVAAGVAAALALAASVTLVVRSQSRGAITAGLGAATELALGASAEPGVDVDVVESAGDFVKVFYLSTETSATTSVIVWVDESGGNAP